MGLLRFVTPRSGIDPRSLVARTARCRQPAGGQYHHV
jgi:hypothetical protein